MFLLVLLVVSIFVWWAMRPASLSKSEVSRVRAMHTRVWFGAAWETRRHYRSPHTGGKSLRTYRTDVLYAYNSSQAEWMQPEDKQRWQELETLAEEYL